MLCKIVLHIVSTVHVYMICQNSTNNSNMSELEEKKEQVRPRDQYETSFDSYDSEFVMNSIQNILVFVFMPLACFIGLVLNIHTIRTIKKNEKSELKEDFYIYMSFNSKFNCIYCSIYLFYPIHLCNQYKNDYFCSTIFNSLLAQYYKIYFEVYLGESIRMCSNIM
jgi:hypothetical protein